MTEVHTWVLICTLCLAVWKLVDIIDALITWAYLAAIKHRYRQKGKKWTHET